MYTSVALLPSFSAFFRRVCLPFALVTLLAFAFGATGLQAYTITLSINGTFGSPPTSGSDPLGLAGTNFSVTTSINTTTGPTYPLGSSTIILKQGTPSETHLAGSGGTATLSVSGGSTTLALNNVMALGTFSASATVPSSVVGSNPGPFPTTTFSNGSVTYVFGSSTTLSATGTVGGTTTATNISANPTSLSYSYQTGNSNPPNQSFQVLNATAVPYTASVTGGSFLSIASGASGTTPGTVAVAVNPAGLTAGTYNGQITVTSTGAPNTVLVPVTLTVTSPVLPTFTVSPPSLTFNFQSGGSTPASQLVSLSSSGAQITFTDSTSTTSGGSWLAVSSASGATPGSVGVSVSPGALAVGTYTGTVTFTPTGAANGPQFVTVTLNVTAPAPTFTAAPSSLTFNYQAGSGTFPPSQAVALSSSGAAISFTDSVATVTGGSWLSASPSAGSTPGSVTVSVTPGSLTPGTYTGTVTFTPTGAANGPQMVGVTLVITAGPTFTASPGTLSFNYQTGGAVPSGQSVALSSSGSALSFTDSASTTSGGAWLSVSPSGGTTPTSATVSVAPASLAPGTYTGTVTFTPTGSANGLQTVNVTLVVTAAPTFSASPSSLTFNYQSGGAVPPGQSVALSSSGSAISFTDSASTTSGGAWLAVSPSGGTTPASATVSVAPASLAPGTYTGTVIFTPTGAANGPQTVGVTLTVTAAPVISASASSVSFTYQIGGATPANQTVTLTGNAPSLAFTDSVSGAPWLMVTPASGATPSTLTFAVNPATLTTPGTFSGTVIIASGSAGVPPPINVSITVTAAPTLTLSTNTASFNYQIGSAAPAAQAVTVTTSNPGLTFSAVSDMPWLVVTPAGGTTPGSVSLSLSTASLTTPGTFTGHVTVSASGTSNSPQVITVTTTVTPAPNIQASPSALSFAFQLGGSQPATQMLNITSSGTPLTFTSSTATPWLVVTGSGSTPGTVNVDVNTTGLTAQTYNGSITITAAGSTNGSVTVPVTLTVSSQPTLSANPSVLSFTSTIGGSTPAAQSVAVATTSGAIAYTLAATTTTGGAWLSVSPTSGTTPGSFSASVAPGSLAAGTYNGTVTITAAGTSNSPLVIPVTYTVNAAPTLTATPSPLTFTFQQGGPAPANQALNIGGTAGLNYTASASTTSGGSWLTLTNPTGTTPGTVTVAVTPGSLTVGTYSGTITTSAPGAASIMTPVTLTVTSAPILTVAPTTLSFSYTAGSSTLPPGQSVTLTSSGTPLNFTAAASTTSGGSWLAAFPASGTTPGSVTVSVTPSSLAAGTYSGTVTLTSTGAGNGPQTVAVTLTVTAATPTLTVAPTSLSFSYQAGSSTLPATQSVALSSSGTPINFTAAAATTSGGSWLAVAPTSGATPATLTVTVTPGSLTPGTYTGTVTVTPTGATNGPQTVTVTLTVTSSPTLTAAPASLSFSYTAGSSTIPPSQAITLTSSGSPITFTTGATTASGGSWLAVSPSGGTTPGTVAVSVTPSALAAGTYSGTITFTPTGGSAPITVPVTLTVGAASTFSVSPGSLSFNYAAGSSTLPANQSLTVSSSGSPISFTAAAATVSGGGWLAVSPSGGTTPGTLTVSVTPGALAAGTYSGSVTVTPGGGLPVTTIPVTLTVTSTATPTLTVAPNPITFTYQAGSSTLPAGQAVTITSSGTPVSYNAAVTIFSGGSWLTLFPISGTTPGSVLLTATPGSLAPGTYTASLSVTSAGVSNSPVNVPITLTVTSSPVLSASPSGLTFNFTTGGATPAAQIISVASSGATLSFTTSGSGAGWLSVSGGGTTPSAVTVSANPAGLTAGTYNATVTLTPGGGASAVLVPVTLNVVSSATLAPSPTSLTFNFQLSGGAPAPQTISVGSTGSPLGFSVSLTNLPWLTVTPTTGTTGSTALTATVNPAGLAAGNYGGTITIATGTSAAPSVIPVTLVVSSSATSPISASANPVIFNYLVGSTIPGPKTVSLASATPVGYTVTASTASWLAVMPSSGTTPGSITITATPGALAPGSYAASVSVSTAGYAPLVIPVFLSITPAPALTATPTSLAFAFQNGGSLPAPQTVTVVSSGVAFTAAAAVTGPWLSVTPPSADTPGTFSVAANPAGLLPGVYNGSVTFTGAATNSPVNVPVVLTVGSGPGISASPALLTFNFKSGGLNPAPETVALASSAGPLAFTAASNSPWLTIVSPAGSTAPGTLTVTADPASLVTGSYTGTITVTPTGGGTPITLPVEFNVNSAAVPNLKAVTNALSYATGAVAPGEIVNLWGTGLGPVASAGIELTPAHLVSSNIGNVRVLFDGIPAVLTMVSDKQVNAVVPNAVAGNANTVVQVEYQGVPSNALTVPIAPSAPGLATFNASGMGEGAILNQDTSVNSVTNPAAAGSVIVLFGTGGGQTNPPSIDGIIPGSVLFMPVLPVSATVGGVNATVLYAGSSPNLVSGVLQFNVLIPSSVGPGPEAVVIKIGSASSQAGYTVVVK